MTKTGTPVREGRKKNGEIVGKGKMESIVKRRRVRKMEHKK